MDKLSESKRAEVKLLVAKMKIFGDAMRGTAFRMNSDPIELIPFFDHIEHLFADLKVDENMKVKLVRPFLNDRAKSLLARMDVSLADDYGLVKNYLLREFQLSPRVYLELFHTVNCATDETYLLFASRLKGLFDFYMSSRKVKSLNDLVSLIIADRLKQTLSEGCLRHVLSVEASVTKQWLGYDKLAEAVDTYMANHLHDKPRTGFQSGRSYEPKGTKVNAPSTAYVGDVGKTMRVGGDVNPTAAIPAAGKVCYRCNTAGHLAKSCPSRPGAYSGASQSRGAGQFHGHNDSRGNVKVVRCAAEAEAEVNRVEAPVDNTVTARASRCAAVDTATEARSTSL
jgi:hypothetical protein